ncbi:MAG TPA: PAS domain-containing sensor histidine kinase [Candidatus Limnocylindria bacterium]|nr:PAS domain-containing sensor histidine kinase [Candidatus Limnocylindria bacterium]
MQVPAEPGSSHAWGTERSIPTPGELSFRLLVDAVQDYAIFLISASGEVLTWNLGAHRIKGYTPDEIIGNHFSVFYPAEDRDAGLPERLLEKARREGRVEHEGWRVRKDGTRFWADVVITALRDETGETVAFAKVTRDLTERRAAEDQQRALVAEQRARAAAEEALLARDRFLSIAAHELKTPVTSLRLAAESLFRAKTSGRLTEDRLSSSLQRMITATQRLGLLLNELLDVARLSSGALPYDPEPTDVVALIREALSQYSELAEARRIRLVSAPESAWVQADPRRLEQALTNVIDNAVKFSADSEPVDVSISEDEQGVAIDVVDRGIGLGSEGAERIFEAFGRAPNAEHVPGMGLGLYIARQMVARHGGTIEAMPRQDGPGARFVIRIPRRSAEP